MSRRAAADGVAADVLELLALSDSPDLNRVLRRILESARQRVGARYAALGVPDGRGGFARFVTAGISERRAAQIGELPRTHGVLGALLEGGSILLDDIRRHPRFAYYPAHHPEMTDFLGVPVTHAGAVLGNLFVSGHRSGPFGSADRHALETLAAYAGVAIANADVYGRTQELAVVEERNRVARELHDAASQTLFSLVLEARAAALGSADEATRRRFGGLEAMAAAALGELRGLVHALRPKGLEHDGLAATLADHAEALRRSHGAAIRIDADPEVRLALEDEHALLRIAQEALHNAVRHAPGAPIRVRLAAQRDGIVLRVRDEGPGFDTAALPHTVRSLGLTTMRERAAALGAALTVESAPGGGCTVSVSVPAARRGRG